MVKEYLRPKTPEEALALLRGRSGSRLLSGGTYLLSSRFAGEPMTLISLAGILPDKAGVRGKEMVLGANLSFSGLLETDGLPAALMDAAMSMGNRNIRNRATVGGNIGADKSCSSLIPFFVVSRARYERVDMSPVDAEAWSSLDAAERGIVSGVIVPSLTGRKIVFGRFGRVAGDVSIVTCAVSAELSGEGRLKDVLVAMGGMAPKVRRFPEIERLFEGSKVPSAAEVERGAAPYLNPVSDIRGSESYKRRRGAALLADLLASFTVNPAEPTAATEARAW